MKINSKEQDIMKSKTLFTIVFITFLLSNCTSNYEYWDISKFNLVPSSLLDEEKIKLLYTSRGPNYNKNKDYYVHFIAVSVEKGDTINILSTTINNIGKNDQNTVFSYFDQNNIVSKLLQIDTDELIILENIKNIKPKKINRVARDPKFDYIADNTYPTVIGNIGTVSNIEK